jgi:BASS family bile acid:Na+ symporter
MIIKLALPAGLAFIMFAIGLTLQLVDFTRITRQPRAVLLGLFCQLVLLPVLAFTLLNIWHIDPMLSVGIMILAASPGGITSNLLTHFARGDTALSITLTAISSLLGMVTIPFIVTVAMTWFANQAAPEQMPVWPMILGIFAISTLPLVIGMAINHRKPALAENIERFARPVSVLVFAAIVISAFAAQWNQMITYLPVIGLPVILLNGLIMVVGYTLAVTSRTGRRAARAIALEGGLQNGAIGIFVATTLIGMPVLAIPSITYALIMNVSAAVFIAIVQITQRKKVRQ